MNNKFNKRSMGLNIAGRCLLSTLVVFSFSILFNQTLAQYQDLKQMDAKVLHLKAIRNYQNDEQSEHHFFDVNGNLIESKFYQSVYTRRLFEYNQLSQLIKSWEFDDDDCMLDEVHIRYNKKQLAICATLSDGEGALIYRDSTHYTKNGKEQEFTRFSKSGKIRFGFLFYYDKKGRLKTRKEYNSKKQLEYTTNYTYGKQGKIEKEITINACGEEDIKWETFYDASGNEVKTICTGDCITGGWQKKYNEESQVIEYVEYNKERIPYRIFSYQYDSAGNKSESVLVEAGKVIEKQQFFYNDKHLLMKTIKGDGDVFSSTYEFYGLPEKKP